MHLILINGGHEGSPSRRLGALVGGNKGGRRLLSDGDDGFAFGFALFHFGERLVDLFERVDRVDGGFQRMVFVEQPADLLELAPVFMHEQEVIGLAFRRRHAVVFAAGDGEQQALPCGHAAALGEPAVGHAAQGDQAAAFFEHVEFVRQLAVAQGSSTWSTLESTST